MSVQKEGERPGKDKRDVKDRNCEHAPEGILGKRQAVSQAPLQRTYSLKKAACSAFSVNISTAMG